MKYIRHFSNQHQKLYHISKAQANTFSYGHPKLLIFSFTKRLAKNKETFKRHIFPPRARLQCIYSVWKLLKKSHLSEFEALWKLLLHYLIQFSYLWVEGLPRCTWLSSIAHKFLSERHKYKKFYVSYSNSGDRVFLPHGTLRQNSIFCPKISNP